MVAEFSFKFTNRESSWLYRASVICWTIKGFTNRDFILSITCHVSLPVGSLN